ncbi:MAG: hypothetical protein M3Y71_02475 [Actinomycetota bacterium]|nr:hypothetical protein [Actinomycetota bacterium]
MSVLENLVLVLHLLGMAAILGGWFATRTSPRVHPAVLWGARAQLVTGLLLVGLVEAANDPADPPNHPKIGVKLIVALGVLACVEIANARQKRAGLEVSTGGGSTMTATTTAVAAPLVQVAAALTLLNVLVAVLWT